MNMFARFDENPAMTLEDIKETKRYGWTDTRTDNVKTVYPPQTKFAGGGGYKNSQQKTKVVANKERVKCPCFHIQNAYWFKF